MVDDDPVTKANALGTAYDSTRTALALADKVTPPERALIEALTARYPQRGPIEKQKPWNDDFAAAMKRIYKAHPHDLEVATIYAEAILNQTPWKMWNIWESAIAEGAGTVQVQKLLEKFVDTPEGRAHPGILHLYVHLMEMSPTPEKALMAGDRLRTGARCRPPDPYADPYRHPVRPIPRRDVLEPEGDRGGPQGCQTAGAEEFVHLLPRPQLPFRHLCRDVPRAVRACHSRSRGNDT